MKDIELPPLPEYSELGENYGYTAEDMQAYARAAVEANSVPDGLLNALEAFEKKERSPFQAYLAAGLVDERRAAMLSASPAPAQQERGEVVVTTTENGQCIAVTRQNSEGRVLSVIWQADFAQQEHKPMTDPCPGCKKGGVCRTPKCGRLALPVDHPLRSGIKE